MPQDLSNVDSVLLDIEGTICPITFVKDTLFPYAINALPEVLQKKWNDPEFIRYRDAFPVDARSSPEALEAHVKDLTVRDVKVAYLKNLQGYLWQAGYESGAYSTPLFLDVLVYMHIWRTSGLSCSIYSSGSVFAQKLLFAHIRDNSGNTGTSVDNTTATIDRTDMINEWFDTTNAGPKTEPGSYRNIAGDMKKNAGQILFLSDNVNEIKAALEAGMKAIVVDRPGNAPLSKSDRETYEVVTTFDQIQIAQR